MTELREGIILFYCNDICNFNDSCKVKHNDCPKCNLWADKILSQVRQYLEEKRPKRNNMKWKDTYHRDYYKGFNDCLAEIRTIIEGIK